MTKRTIHFDIDPELVGDISLDDTVNVVVTGTVEALSKPWEFEDEEGEIKRDKFGDMRLKISKIKMRVVDNEFEEMARNEMEDV